MFCTIYNSLIGIMGARSLRARVPNNSRIIVDYNFNWVSVLGLFFPISMSALILVQVIYKTLWLLVYAMPRMLNQRSNEVPWGIASTFLIIIVTYPWIIPWGQLFFDVVRR